MDASAPVATERPASGEPALAHRRAKACAEARHLVPEGARREVLTGILRLIDEQEGPLVEALWTDMGRSPGEAWTSELVSVHDEAKHALRHLKGWIRPERVRTPLKLMPSYSRVAYEPKGTVLVIGSWNLPVTVSLSPVVAALAAGNAVVLKPSELAPASSRIMAELVPRYCGRAVQVVEGGAETTTALLGERWDHVFFTGSTRVGRIVAEAAARHLTPLTLELGGQCAAYVHRSANLMVAARRIAWGKWMNAGQVCIAPNHVFVDEVVSEAFVDALEGAVRDMYGDDPSQAEDYARIINVRHYDRIMDLSRDHGGADAFSTGTDRNALFIGPSAVLDPSPSSPLMSEEIFGPPLPVCRVSGPEEALARIAEAPPPLALYPFTKDKVVCGLFEKRGRAGAVVTNDVTVNHGVRDLPFGGVGESGHGTYHGIHGFRTFSVPKAIMRRPTWPDPSLRYPPYTEKNIALMRRLR